MPFEAHSGLNFHVQELGNGPPIVLLHGLLVGSMATWYFSLAPLLARTHRVLLYDLRGHGKSERARSGYDLATMAADLRSLSARFEQPIILVGHSYGAVIALYFALQAQARVDRLVLVEAPLPVTRLTELQSFLDKPAGEMLEALPLSLKASVARGGRQALRFAGALHSLLTETSLLADLRRSEDIPDAALVKLSVPVLCIYGSESSCRPSGERLARLLPDARLVTLNGGHFLPVEAPQSLSAQILEFVHG